MEILQWDVPGQLSKLENALSISVSKYSAYVKNWTLSMFLGVATLENGIFL